MPNIIVDKITRKETAKFEELKPGTVFQFTERYQIGKYYLFIQPIELDLSGRNKYGMIMMMTNDMKQFIVIL